MITKRDQDIFNFLQESRFYIATSNQLHKIFFKDTSYRYSRKRLQYLNKELGILKKTTSTIDNCNAYFIEKRPSQIHHDLIRTELYSHIIQKYKILEWNNEPTIVNIRPDALTYIDNAGVPTPVFIEIHLNNKFNFEKYKDLINKNDLKSVFGIIPRVIICTDRQITIPNIGIRFSVVGIDMNGINSIFHKAI